MVVKTKAIESGQDEPSFRIIATLFVMLICCATFVEILESQPPKVAETGIAASFTQDHARNAHLHVEALCAMGSRTIGSYQNEILAPKYLIQQLIAIRATAGADIDVQIAVQHPSGAFTTPFLGGIVNVYENVTNVICRIAHRQRPPPGAGAGAILVNAHFDSSLGSPGAGDDVAQVHRRRRYPLPLLNQLCWKFRVDS
jgi:hypothetical protein